MAEINWTPEAERWLRNIHDYIARDNSTAAIRTLEGICRKVHTLRDAPEWGYRYEHISNRNVRILLYGHHRIAYLVRDDGDIDLLGIFHAALDIERCLS